MSVISVEKDFDSLSLTLVAELDAPIERAWRLWADPRQLERWWGPPTHPATVEKHDLAAGGEVGYVVTGPGGEESRGWWQVASVNPTRSLEFTDGFANRDGTPNAEMPTTAVQVRLTEHDGGTRMELRFVFGSSEHMERLERSGAFEVFPQSVGQMDALLAADVKTGGTREGSAKRRCEARDRTTQPRRPSSAQDQVELLHLPRWRRRVARRWRFPYFDDEMGAAVGAGFATADALLMGRVLYDEWAAYWPEHADEPFGDVMNSMKKYVVSNSLRAAEWRTEIMTRLCPRS